jgi:hypothetical protein
MKMGLPVFQLRRREGKDSNEPGNSPASPQIQADERQGAKNADVLTFAWLEHVQTRNGVTIGRDKKSRRAYGRVLSLCRSAA